MEPTFSQIAESISLRFQQGGFVEQDYVTFKKDVMKHPDIVSRPAGYREAIMEMINSKLNLKISAIKPVRYASGPSATMNYLADVILESAPGLAKYIITVPTEVLEMATPYNNWPNVPDSIRHDFNNTDKMPKAPDQTMAQDSHRQLRQK